MPNGSTAPATLALLVDVANHRHCALRGRLLLLLVGLLAEDVAQNIDETRLDVAAVEGRRLQEGDPLYICRWYVDTLQGRLRKETPCSWLVVEQ